MRNKRMKWWSLAILSALVLSLCTLPKNAIKAASFYVSASARTVYVGDQVTFYVGSKGGCGKIYVSGAAQDVIWLENDSRSYTVTAKHPGVLKVEGNGVIADLRTTAEFNAYDSASVQVIERVSTPSHPSIPQSSDEEEVEEIEASDDNFLASLSVSDATLSPAFKKDVFEYEVSVKNTTKSITLKAKASDKNAQVKGIGKKEVEVGKQTFKISVTAENGDKRVYKVSVIVDDTPLAYVDYHGKKLGVSPRNMDMPNKLFTKGSITIDGVSVPAWKNDHLKRCALYLENDGKQDFYFYDEASKKVTSIYRPMAILNENIALIDVPKELQEREDMTFGEVDVDGVKFPGWTYDDEEFKNYALIYVMNEAGETVYYQYEKSEKSLQIYSNAACLTQERYEVLQKQSLWSMIACGVFAILFIVILIAYLKMRKERKNTVSFKKTNVSKQIRKERANLEKDTIIQLQQEEREK